MPREGGKKKLKKLMHMSSYHTTATGMDILPPNYEYKNKHIFRYLSLFLIDIAVHFFSSAVLN